MKNKVIITVEKDSSGKGYTLRHNQEPGFKGIIGYTFAWYKFKRDAKPRAKELEKCWN